MPARLQHQRRGAAIVLGLIILAALLMMGLPFVYSQSVALAGSTTFASRQAADAGRSSSQDLALSLGEQATRQYLPTGRIYSVMDMDMKAGIGVPGGSWAALPETALPNLIRIDVTKIDTELASTIPLNLPRTGATRFGVNLIDEGGKLDVNDLTEAMWSSLGVDNAKALADYRFLKYDQGKPQRIERLDELLYKNDGVTKLLTRVEIEGIRPYVTAYGMAQGRERLVDLGSVIYAGKITTVTLTSMPAEEWVRITLYGHTKTRKITPQNWMRKFQWGGFTTFDPNDPVITDGDGNPISPGYERKDRMTMTFDGFVEGTMGHDSVLVLRDPKRSDDDPQRRIFIRLSDRFTIKGEDLMLEGETLNTSDTSEKILDAFTSGFRGQWISYLNGTRAEPPTPYPAAVEMPSPVNLHHAPEMVRDLINVAPDKVTEPGSSTITSYTNSQELFARLGNLIEMSPDVIRSVPPFTLRSNGIVGFQARVAAGDRRDRVVAAGKLGGTAQIPGTGDVTFTWRHLQGDFELVDSQGRLANLATWPEPMERIDDWSFANLANAGEAGPRVMDTYALSMPEAMGKNLWLVELSGADRDDLLEKPVQGTVDEVTVDGVTLGGTLAYLKDDLLPANTTDTAWAVSRHEVGGRQFSCWLKPTGALSGKQPLVELRCPATNCFPQLDGTAGSNEYQNTWQLYYENGWFVLALAGPAIEHTTEAVKNDGSGLSVPEDDFTTPFFNEQSLGSDATNPAPLAPAMPFNRVEYRYYAPDLKADRWYQMHVLVSHDRPGGQVILLDGIAGRDAAGLPPTAALQAGDHLTLPCLVLDEDLPAVDPATVTDGTYLRDFGGDSSLKVRLTNIHAELGLKVADILPSRGTVLIGNEYISYTGINNNELTDCYRGLRANTNTRAGPARERWPTVEEHAVGKLVVPGGFRFNPVREVPAFTGTPPELLRGGATAVNVLVNGDPAPPVTVDPNLEEMRWRCWGRLSVDFNDYDPAICVLDDNGTPANPADDFYQVTIDPTALPPYLTLQKDPDADGTDTGCFDFPARSSIVRLKKLFNGGEEMSLYYETGTPNGDKYAFDTLEAVTVTSISNQTITFRIPKNKPEDANPPWLWLMSYEVLPDASCAVDDVNDFVQEPKPFDQKVIQIEDPATGRIEWLSYDTVLRHNAVGEHQYFIARDGWTRKYRGAQRTCFAGDHPQLDPTTSVFPAGAPILPVQTQFNDAHWFVTGDVVTLLPKDADGASPAMTPAQMVVRFAATDGYHDGVLPPWPGPDSNPQHDEDTKNEWFAFTQKVPADYDTTTFEFVQGLCWCGKDLSSLNPINSNSFINGYMPLQERMADNCYLFSGDPDNGAGGQAPVALDCLTAADVRGAAAGTTMIGQLEDAIVGTARTLTIDATTNVLGALFKVDNANLVNWISEGDGGLIMIGGEVFAFRKSMTGTARSNYQAVFGTNPGSNWIEIVGRGLLGSEMKTHRIYEAIIEGKVIRSGPPVVPLPVGPVSLLQSQLTKSFAGRIRNAEDTPPMHLLCSPTGDRVEFIRTNDQTVYPWMRGLYNTVVSDWSDDCGGTVTWTDPDGRRPLLIGWWPRWPSALPQGAASTAPAHLDNDEWSAMLRSRSYMWAGFSLRMLKMDATSASFQQTAADGFRVTARSLNKGFHWSDGKTWGSFDGPDDGVECKLLWEYTDPPSSDFLDTVERLHRKPPAVTEVTLGAHAPFIYLERDNLQ